MAAKVGNGDETIPANGTRPYSIRCGNDMNRFEVVSNSEEVHEWRSEVTDLPWVFFIVTL